MARMVSRGTVRRRTVTRPRSNFRVVHLRDVVVADGTVTPATTRLTNLGTTLESSLGQDIGGMKIMGVRAHGSLIATVGGIQSYSYAIFPGVLTLDAADVQPTTAPQDFPWWVWRHKLYRGQAHLAAAATSEFDEHAMSFRTRGSRRMSTLGTTLWFAEETVGQAQNAAWRFDVAIDVS